MKEKYMLKKDRELFIWFVSGDEKQVQAALKGFESRERGHFEAHPMSAKLVKENLNALVELWEATNDEICMRWVLQFIADTRIADPSVKPLVVHAIANARDSLLPTILYLMGSMPTMFDDLGSYLIPLAKHPDREVRWRVAWFISRVDKPDASMKAAIMKLEQDSDNTTQIYVHDVKKRVGF